MDDSSTAPRTENKPASTLVPPILLKPAASLWLWLLPIAILCLLNFQGYWLIEGEMTADQRHTALLVGLSGLANVLIGLGVYALSWLTCRKNGREFLDHFSWGIPVIVVQMAYLWFVLSVIDRIIPRSVTSWIFPPERFIFSQFAFGMLPLFSGILRIAGARSDTRIGRGIALNLGVAVGAPVLLYLVFTALRSFQSYRAVDGTIVAVAVVSFGIVMFLALVRALLLILHRMDQWQVKGERIAIVIFALLMPVGGLLLNRNIPFPVSFQAWEVYVLVVLNTAILLITAWQHEKRPLLSFGLLCGTFPFSLYFFIVFLPFVPLSILALIILGAGFLVLSPILLFTLHLHLLYKAQRNVTTVRRTRVVLVGLVCVSLLPAYFTLRALADKTALNAALEYVYNPAIKTGKTIYSASVRNLRRAIDSHRDYKNGLYYPFLSDYYSWLVFDNLVLPDDKLDQLDETFFGVRAAGAQQKASRNRTGTDFAFFGTGGVRAKNRMPRAAPVSHTVEATRLDVRCSPIGVQQTVVTLALTLENKSVPVAEYVMALPLPAGIYVTGFRLRVNDQLVPGRIFEKKTALWVYTMIRDSERRDPGLLYYASPNELELRVFPINHEKPGVVEIDFLVPAVVAAGDLPSPTKDAAEVLAQIGKQMTPQFSGDGHGHAFLAGLKPDSLPSVVREPYLHLIVDRSASNGYTGEFAGAIRRLRERFPLAKQVRVTFANYDVVDPVVEFVSFDDLSARMEKEWAKILPLAGGLQLDHVIAHALREHRELDLDGAQSHRVGVPPRPVFVILSGKAVSRPLKMKFAEVWSDALPELEILEMGADGSVFTHQISTADARPVLRLGNSIRPLVSKQGTWFNSNEAGRQIEFWSPHLSAWRPLTDIHRADGSEWSHAVELHSLQRDFDASPGDAVLDLKSLVRRSRESGVLLASTSYIVVENSAQWKMLQLSERGKLGQNSALDLQEAPAPSVVVVVAGLALWLGVRRRRQARTALFSANGG